MRCPFCHSEDTKVVDSRLAADGFQVRRRRECTVCSERFTTFEGAELIMPQVIKNNGTREAFAEDKLRAGIVRALEKRPVGTDAVEAAISRLRRRIRASGEREVASRQIGEWVMLELQALDQVAYVRFASVYRSFEDVNEFREEIARLESQPPPDIDRHQMPLLPDEKG